MNGDDRPGLGIGPLTDLKRSAGRLDAVCSAATVTPERARTVDFCTPHLTLTLAVVMRDGAKTLVLTNAPAIRRS